MAIVEPTVGQSNWGPVLNAALTQLDTLGPSNALHAQTLSVSGAVTIDASTGQHQKITLAANATSSSITNPSSGQKLIVEWTQDATGARTYAWPAGIVWTQGAAPNASRGANKSDIFTFVYDGTNWVETSRLLGVAAATFAPTAAAGSNAGTTPPAPVVAAGSNDLRGSLTAGTGTTPAAGNLIVVTFGQTYASAPGAIVTTPANSASAALNEYVTSISATGFTIGVQTAPAASQANTVYAFNYHVDF